MAFLCGITKIKGLGDMFTLKERIDALCLLGKHLQQEDDYLDAVIHQCAHNNLWLTKENCQYAIQAIATEYLNREAIEKWVAKYFIDDKIDKKTIGLIFSGFSPLECFHDFLCAFVMGHKSLVVLDDRDKFLFPYLVKLLVRFDDRSGTLVEVVENLKSFDAVILNGKTDKLESFEQYFSSYPNLIRRPQNAVAILDQSESLEELDLLADDVFTYFGLNKRNVSKLYLPKDYDFNPVMETFHERNRIVLHGKYKNNFDFNYAICLLNSQKIVANGCIILTENEDTRSRISGLHYEFYEDKTDLINKLKSKETYISNICSKLDLPEFELTPFGRSLKPTLDQYFGKQDTIHFLLSLN